MKKEKNRKWERLRERGPRRENKRTRQENMLWKKWTGRNARKEKEVES